MPKICIDAGHYGKYNCNKNVNPVYWESLMAWELQGYLVSALERYENMITVLVRTDEKKDMDVYTRGTKAQGCDLFVSLHSNSCDSETVDRAVVIYPIDGREKDLAQKIADTIKDVMNLNDKSKIYSKKNSAGNADYYGVIRGAAAVGVPGLIFEHSFHSHNASARWLLVSDNLKQLAEAEAAVIAARYGCKLREDDAVPDPDARVGQHHPFTDVPDDCWSAAYIQAAWEMGLMNGVTETEFRRKNPMTREQAAALAVRICGIYDQKIAELEARLK